MNIFCTDSSPIRSAMYLDDVRINKMIVESAQMLSTVIRRYGVGNGIHYKSAYQNHPCTLWAGETRGNFLWLCDHALAMCAIYTKTRGREHASERVIQFCYKLAHKVKAGDVTEFADCTEFKDRKDIPIIERYRLFMNLKWNERDKKNPTWRNRKVPDWYTKKELVK